MKTIFKHFLTTAMLLLVSVSMNAEVYSGDCGIDGDNVKWTLDTDTGILTIYGKGMMANFNHSSPPRAPWYDYRFNIYTIEVNGEISNIGDYSFDYCNKLTTITIPESVTSIGNGAFYGCSGLTSIIIPKSVTSIGSSAFYGCSGLTSINIPDGVTSIGSGAFERCSSLPIENNLRYADTYLVEAVDKTLSTYNIKDGTRFIGPNAFSDCSNLTSITIPKRVTSIGAYAFSGCSGLTSINIPERVTTIGNAAFNGCSALPKEDNLRYADTYLVEAIDKTLSTYNIKEGTRFIGYGAFRDCSSLTSINIPESVIGIGDYAFYGCSSLTSITIPESVTSIGYEAFSGCSGLTSITIPESVTSIGAHAFNKCIGELIVNCNIPDSKRYDNSPFYYSKFTSVTINGSIIGNYAFYGCSTITSIELGNYVTSIGDAAFLGCTGLTSIYIPDSVTNIGAYPFEGCSIASPIYVGKFFAYFPKSYEGEYIIPETIETICGRAFYGCSGLTSVTIPEGVTSIGYGAFWGCSSLSSINIPPSVTSIGGEAFRFCSNLASINISEGVMSIGQGAFSNCPSLLYSSFGSVENLCAIKFGNSLSNPLYYAHHLYIDGKEVKELVIPEVVDSISDYAFFGCSDIASITISSNIKSIGVQTFSGCTSLSVINALGTTPPTIVNNTFDNTTYSTAFLYIPTGCEEAYGTAEGWKNFAKIREKDFGVKDCLLALKGISGVIVSMKSKTMTQYSFQITADEGWKVSSVSFNGSDVTSELAQNGSYTTPALTGDSELSIVFEQDGNEVKEVGEDGQLRVFASGSAVTIQNNGDPQQVSVYTTDGKSVKQTIAERGNTRIPLNEGNVYLLKIGERTFKVAM